MSEFAGLGPKNSPWADADLARPNQCQAHHHRPPAWL